MPDYARVLGLAPYAMRTIALAHAGYGIAQQREAHETEARLKDRRDQLDAADARQQLEELGELRMVAASELAIGASLYAIMFPRIARVLFRAAARSYDRLGLEYAAILGLCGRDTETADRQWRRQRERPRLDDDGGNIPARLLLATERAIDDPEARSETARILEQIAPLRGVLIGSAGIPASIYREWAAAVLDIVESKGDAPR